MPDILTDKQLPLLNLLGKWDLGREILVRKLKSLQLHVGIYNSLPSLNSMDLQIHSTSLLYHQRPES